MLGDLPRFSLFRPPFYPLPNPPPGASDQLRGDDLLLPASALHDGVDLTPAAAPRGPGAPGPRARWPGGNELERLKRVAGGLGHRLERKDQVGRFNRLVD